MQCVQPFLFLLTVSLFNLLNRAGKYVGLSLVFHLRDLLFHLKDHTTRISLAHCLKHQGQKGFQTGDFLRQLLVIFRSGEIRCAHSFSSL